MIKLKTNKNFTKKQIKNVRNQKKRTELKNIIHDKLKLKNWIKK